MLKMLFLANAFIIKKQYTSKDDQNTKILQNPTRLLEAGEFRSFEISPAFAGTVLRVSVIG
jgi:hypothetical protein